MSVLHHGQAEGYVAQSRRKAPPTAHTGPVVHHVPGFNSLKVFLADLAVARPSGGRPRTRPAALLGDKAYSSAGNRELLRRRRVKTVIPQPADQVAHRQRRGSAGGRPPDFDATTYKGRNVIKRSFNDHKHWRGPATRYDKLATTYRGGVVLRAIAIWLRQ